MHFSISKISLVSSIAVLQVVQNFHGNHRAENYEELVDKMLKMNHLMSARIVTEDAFLNFFTNILILTLFPLNLSDVSNGHREGVHRDMKAIENQYQENLIRP